MGSPKCLRLLNGYSRYVSQHTTTFGNISSKPETPKSQIRKSQIRACRRWLNGDLAQRVRSLFLASSFRMCLNCAVLKGMFPWRTRYPFSRQRSAAVVRDRHAEVCLAEVCLPLAKVSLSDELIKRYRVHRAGMNITSTSACLSLMRTDLAGSFGKCFESRGSDPLQTT